jgi:hypothetical protein
MGYGGTRSPARRRVSVYLEGDMYGWLRAQAAAHERSVSAYVRIILVGLRRELEAAGAGAGKEEDDGIRGSTP